MKTRAAIAFTPGAPLEVCEVDLAPPGQDEVLVKIEACGICHTDVTAWQLYAANQMPIVFGHEGAGSVIETGAGACGECGHCRSGRHNLCQRIEPFPSHASINSIIAMII